MIKSVTQHSYFEKKPASRWVDFKTTHLNGTGAPKIYTCASINLGQ